MELAILNRLLTPSRLLEATVKVKAHQRRDDKTGKLERVKAYMRVYHGTRQSNLDSILAKGLKPQNYRNWDFLPQGENEKEVFVTNDPELARRFGRVASREGPFAIIEADIPSDIEMEVDDRVEVGAREKEFMRADVKAWKLDEVKPQWFKKIHFYEVDHGDFGGATKHQRTVVISEVKKKFTKVYIPVSIDNPLIAAHIEEATTTVDRHVRHSSKGKAFTVRQHEREVEDILPDPEKGFIGTAYHGGKPSNAVGRIHYFTIDPDVADSYVDMYNDRAGEGGAVYTAKVSITNPAPWSTIEAQALNQGIDNELYTPASVFDVNIHDPKAVARMRLKLMKLS
jgi:hypothetical protein